MASSRGYSSARWRVARARALARQPRCCRCGATTSLIVHHQDGLGMSGDNAVEQSNLIVLCRTCHAHEHGTTNHVHHG